MVLAAATVGGIEANRSRPADFLLRELTNRNASHRNSLEGRRTAIAVSGKQLHLPKVRDTTDKRRMSAHGRSGTNK